jgi:hypothetical protein
MRTTLPVAAREEVDSCYRTCYFNEYFSLNIRQTSDFERIGVALRHASDLRRSLLPEQAIAFRSVDHQLDFSLLCRTVLAP